VAKNNQSAIQLPDDLEEWPMDSSQPITIPDDAEELPLVGTGEPSKLESLLRGAAQGISFSIADEAAGTLGAAGKFLGGETGLDFDKIKEAYLKERDESRAAYEAAEKANPALYTTGDVVGGIATAFVPGLGALNAAKGARLATVAGKAALQGGLTGMGRSEGETIGDIAKDSAIGAGASALFGTGINLGMKGLEKVPFEKAGTAIKEGAKKLGRAFLGSSEEAADRYLNRTAQVNAAKPLGEIAESVIGEGSDSGINKLSNKISELDNAAWSTLNPRKPVGANKIVSKIDELQNGLEVGGNIVGDAQMSAFSALERLKSSLKNADGELINVNERDAKRLIQALDQNINWNDPAAGAKNSVLSGLRTELDMMLKMQNPSYAKAMQPVAEATALLQNVKRTFRNRQDPENVDKFLRLIKNAPNKDEAANVNRLLRQMDERLGTQYGDDVADAWTKSQLSKGDVQGSRRTLLGSVIGGTAGTLAAGPVGGAIGGAVGAGAGTAVDKYAGVAMKNLLDGTMKADAFIQSISGKVSPQAVEALRKASQRGTQAMAATHFILQQQDPEYRKAFQQSNE